MYNNAKRIFALMLAMVLVFSLAGCTKIVYEGSSAEIEYVTNQVYVEGEDDTNNNGDTTTNKTDNKQDTANTDKTDKDNKKDESSNKGNTINDNVNPEDYRGKTIKFAATIHPDNDESGPVVKNFEKEYGIKVEIVQSDQGNYPNQLAGWIAAGNAPDVVRSSGDFPMAMSYLQSLDAAKLDYDEEIWNQKTFEITTFGGSPYLCDTVGNIWAEVDIVAYSKSLLKRANAHTPEEYDAQGKWTWDAFFDIARAVQKVTGDKGCSFASRDSAMHSMGATVYKLENGKFSNGLDNSAVSAMTKFAYAWKDNLISWDSTNDLMQGKVGIITTHAWATKKTGFFKDGNYNDYGFYYLPRNTADSDYSCTGMLRGWGICRGAKEPVASGIFLREYLDVSNYDSASTFMSEEAETFFYNVTSLDYDNWNPYFTYCSFTEELAGFNYMDTIYAVMGYDPAQIAPKMDSMKSAIDRGVKNFNDFVEKNTGLR